MAELQSRSASISLRARGLIDFLPTCRPAAIDGGSLIGVDQTNGKPSASYRCKDAKQHTLVLGTIGSGKTVTPS